MGGWIPIPSPKVEGLGDRLQAIHGRVLIHGTPNGNKLYTVSPVFRSNSSRLSLGRQTDLGWKYSRETCEKNASTEVSSKTETEL